MDRARAPPRRTFRAIGRFSISAFQPVSNSVGPGHPSGRPGLFVRGRAPRRRTALSLSFRSMRASPPPAYEAPQMSGGVLWSPLWPLPNLLSGRGASHRIAGAAFASDRGLRPVKCSTRLGRRSFPVTKAVGRGPQDTTRFLILFLGSPAMLRYSAGLGGLGLYHPSASFPSAGFRECER
jgi:hypothetical protein